MIPLEESEENDHFLLLEEENDHFLLLEEENDHFLQILLEESLSLSLSC